MKVLDSDAVLRRDLASGLSLEALLSSELHHPNIITTFTWAEVHGKVRKGPDLGALGSDLGFRSLNLNPIP